ncbi:MAG: hypothetical protein ACRD7E_01075 [Bryobacteraceae bacterium]
MLANPEEVKNRKGHKTDRNDAKHLADLDDTYQPQPVRQVQIPQSSKPGEFRMLGIPTIYARSDL